MPGRRVFYLNNPSGDIGHAVHLLRLLEALRPGGRNLIFLRAPSSYPHGSFSEYGKVVALPRRPSAASGRALAAAVSRFRPSAMVTEFFPLGRAECSAEILPALSAARAAGARIYASVPMPYFTAPLENLRQYCALYDKVLIHSPEGADLPYMAKAVSLERRVSPADFMSFFRSLGAKAVFTGYMMPDLPRAIRERDFVLVTRGGGSTSDRLVEAALRAAPLIGRPVIVIAGPSTSAGKLAAFRRLAAGREASVLLGMTDMPALIARAAVCISTAGGSVYEMLALRKKMLLVPYCGERGREHSDQLARAWMARDLAGARLLLPADLTSVKIAAAIRTLMARPLKVSAKVKRGWFGGAQKSARIIEAS